jgi:predicted RecB family nuclease
MWSKPSDIADKVKRWWDKGELLSELATPDVSTFPRTINLLKPTSKELSHNFDEVRQWISEINSVASGEIQLQEVNHHIVGRNKIPVSVKFETIHDAIELIGKERQAKKFERLVEKIKTRKPAILPWVAKHPHGALALESDWDKLIDIVDWFETHSDRRIYLRQVDISRVHTKMIEEHKTTLSALLDYVLPISERAKSSNPNQEFESRFGFLLKPLRIRFRILDQRRSIISTHREIQDITLDAATFGTLDPQVKFVYIVENEINFLAFPPLKDALVIFGSGYGFENLARATWLFKHKIFYWGDIDTHGLNILNGARKFLPHMRSIMMDESVLVSHREHWVKEQEPVKTIHLERLTESEHALYDKLRIDFYGSNVRLEQEKLSWKFVEQEITRSVVLYAELTDDDSKHDETIGKLQRFSDYDITQFIQPSRCDLRAYLSVHSPLSIEDRRTTALHELLGRQLQKSKMNALEQLSDVIDVSQHEPTRRIIETAKAIKNQAPVIFGPMLSSTAQIDGDRCEIFGQADFVIRKNEELIVRNLSLSRSSSSGEATDNMIKLQLFGWLLKSLESSTLPIKLEIQNGKGEIATIEFDFGCTPLRKITELHCIRSLPKAPFSPVGWTKCSGCDHQQFCWFKAQSDGDVATIAGVDQKLANTLHRLGHKSITSLVENFDAPTLAELRRGGGGKNQRVGRTDAESIIAMARANLARRHIFRANPEFPEFGKYAIIDFEGMPAFAPNTDFVFLWGMQLFGVDDSKYCCAFAPDLESGSDKNAWFQFLINCEQAFQSIGQIPIFHWHHYERTKIQKYIEHYGDSANTAERVLISLVDLLPIVQKSVALPTPSYSLKGVEPYVGYQRQQKQYGGDWVMSKYLDYIESVNEYEKLDMLKQMSLYNEEDILAANSVLNWLRSIEFS